MKEGDILMTAKNKFELKEVPETLLLPLWGRAFESQKENPFVFDAKAIEIVSKIDYDFSVFEEKLGEYHALSWSIKTKTIDEAIEDFINRYPKATVVHMGCGLDTTFDRVDNGEIMWYDLDLPDVIDFRKKIVPETERRKYISKSIFDYSWFDEIHFSKENNILFMAAGVLIYFEEEELKPLFCKLADSFPGGEMFFDTVSQKGLESCNDVVREVGMKNDMILWAIDSAQEIAKWHDNIKVIDEYTYYMKAPRRKDWDKELIETMDMVDRDKLSSFYHLRFI